MLACCVLNAVSASLCLMVRKVNLIVILAVEIGKKFSSKQYCESWIMMQQVKDSQGAESTVVQYNDIISDDINI